MGTPSPSIDGKMISEMKVADLKLELEKRGLSKGGVKADLIKRLEKAVLGSDTATPAEENPASPALSSEGTPRQTGRKSVTRRKLAGKGEEEQVDSSDERKEGLDEQEATKESSGEQPTVEAVPVTTEISSSHELTSSSKVDDAVNTELQEDPSEHSLTKGDNDIAVVSKELSQADDPFDVVALESPLDEEMESFQGVNLVNEAELENNDVTDSSLPPADTKNSTSPGVPEATIVEDLALDKQDGMDNIPTEEDLIGDMETQGEEPEEETKAAAEDSEMEEGDNTQGGKVEEGGEDMEDAEIDDEKDETQMSLQEEGAEKNEESYEDGMESLETAEEEEKSNMQDDNEDMSAMEADESTYEPKLTTDADRVSVLEKSSEGADESKGGQSNEEEMGEEKKQEAEVVEEGKKDKEGNEQEEKKNAEAKIDTKSEEKGKEGEGQKDGEKKELGKSLWISGLSSVTRAADLKNKFSQCGKVLGAKVVTSARSPGTNCFGFVTMSSVEEATECIEKLNKTELCDRVVTVERAKTDPTPKKAVDKTKQDRKKDDKTQSGAKVAGKSTKPDKPSPVKKKDEKLSGASSNREGRSVTRRDSRRGRSPRKDSYSSAKGSRSTSRSEVSPGRRKESRRDTRRAASGAHSRSPRTQSYPRKRSGSRGRAPAGRRGGTSRSPDRRRPVSRTSRSSRHSRSPGKARSETGKSETKDIVRTSRSPRPGSKSSNVSKDVKKVDGDHTNEGKEEKDQAKSEIGDEKAAEKKEEKKEDDKEGKKEEVKKDTKTSDTDRGKETEQDKERERKRDKDRDKERERKREEERKEREERRKKEKDRELREERRRIQLQREYDRRVRARKEEERIRREREKERELEKERQRERERERERIARERREREQRERDERDRLERERLERERLERDRLQRERLERERLERERLERERLERERVERDRVQRERERLERERIERDSRDNFEKERSLLERERRMLDERRSTLKRPGAPPEREAGRRAIGYWEESKRLALESHSSPIVGDFDRDRDARTVDSSRGRLEVSVRNREESLGSRDYGSKVARDEGYDRSGSNYRRESPSQYAARGREGPSDYRYMSEGRVADSYDRETGRSYPGQSGEDFRRVVVGRDDRLPERSSNLGADRDYVRSRDGHAREEDERGLSNYLGRDNPSEERSFSKDPQKALSDVLERAGLSGILGGAGSHGGAGNARSRTSHADSLVSSRSHESDKNLSGSDKPTGRQDWRLDYDDRKPYSGADSRHGPRFDERRSHGDRRQELDPGRLTDGRRSGADDRRGYADDKRSGYVEKRGPVDERQQHYDERRLSGEDRRHGTGDRRAQYQDRRSNTGDKRSSSDARHVSSQGHGGSRRDEVGSFPGGRSHADIGKRERGAADLLKSSQNAWSDFGMSAKARELLSDANAQIESQKAQFIDSVFEARNRRPQFQGRDNGNQFSMSSRNESVSRAVGVPDQSVLQGQEHWSRSVTQSLPMQTSGRGIFTSVPTRPQMPGRMEAMGMPSRGLHHIRKM